MGNFRGLHSRSARRVIWEEACGPIPEGSWIVLTDQCAHDDCVALRHLRLVATQDRISERVASLKFRWGENHGHAKLTEEEARTILATRSTSADELAARFQVSKATIYAIWAGRRWGHLNATDALLENESSVTQGADNPPKPSLESQ